MIIGRRLPVPVIWLLTHDDLRYSEAARCSDDVCSIMCRARGGPARSFPSLGCITFRRAVVHVETHVLFRICKSVLRLAELVLLEMTAAQQREFLHAYAIPSNEHQVRADKIICSRIISRDSLKLEHARCPIMPEPCEYELHLSSPPYRVNRVKSVPAPEVRQLANRLRAIPRPSMDSGAILCVLTTMSSAATVETHNKASAIRTWSARTTATTPGAGMGRPFRLFVC